MFYEKKRHRILKISLILIFSAAVGIALGYASVRYESFPFLNDKILSPIPEETKAPDKAIEPEPVYTNVVENEVLKSESTEIAESVNPTFLVQAENNKVFLYKVLPDGTKNIEQTLPININALRNEDKKLLEKGINVENKQQLASILEDFGS